jgi:hypothetical protein
MKKDRDASSSLDIDDLNASVIGMSAISQLNVSDDFEMSEASANNSALFSRNDKRKLATIAENPSGRKHKLASQRYTNMASEIGSHGR